MFGLDATQQVLTRVVGKTGTFHCPTAEIVERHIAENTKRMHRSPAPLAAMYRHDIDLLLARWDWLRWTADTAEGDGPCRSITRAS